MFGKRHIQEIHLIKIKKIYNKFNVQNRIKKVISLPNFEVW